MNPTLGVALLVVGTIVRVTFLLTRGRYKAKIDTHDRKRARNARKRARLVGTLRLRGAPIEASLSGRRCAAYVARACVWQAKGSAHLIGDVREAKVARVVIELEDGELEIDPAHVAFDSKTTAVAERSAEREQAFLAARSLDRYVASTEFEEALLAGDERIYVTGFLAVDQNATEVGYRDAPVRRRITGTADAPVLLARAKPQKAKPAKPAKQAKQ